MNRHISKGFTLVEMVITVSLVGVVTAIAIPSMRTAFASNDISAVSSDMVSSLQYARLEAVRKISRTTVKASGEEDAAAWSNGFTISQQVNKNGSYQDTVLKAPVALNPNIQIASATSTKSVTFDSRGYADQAHTIEICDSADNSIEGRRVTVAASGHVTSEIYNCNS